MFMMLASKPKTVKIKQAKSESPFHYLQKLFSSQKSSENEEKEKVDQDSDDSCDSSVQNYRVSNWSRMSSWSTQSLKSFSTQKSVRFEETPILAELIEICETEVAVVTPPKRKKKSVKFFNLFKRFRKQRRSSKNILQTLPLDNDAILYTQSTASIARKRASQLNLPESSTKCSLNHQLLLTRMPATIYHESLWKRCWFHIRRTLLLIFDISMFKSWTFNVLCSGCLFYALGLYVPFMFLTGKLCNFYSTCSAMI